MNEYAPGPQNVATGRGRRRRSGERERERENSKTLFYKDCSLGSVKNLSNN